MEKDRIQDKEWAERFAYLEKKKRYQDLVSDPIHDMFIPIVHYYNRFMDRNEAGNVAKLFMADVYAKGMLFS